MPNNTALAHLRPPWKPGESGHAGRTRAEDARYLGVLKLARSRSMEALKVLLECMNSPEAPWPVRVTAASAVIDRAWGKPKEHIDLAGADSIQSITLNIVRPQGDATETLTINGHDAKPAPETITVTMPPDED